METEETHTHTGLGLLFFGGEGMGRCKVQMVEAVIEDRILLCG